MNVPDEFQNYLDNFEDLELLDIKGDFELHKIRDKSTCKIYCAFVQINDFDDIGRNQFINLLRELMILPNLDHPSINKFYRYSPVDFSNNTRPVIITEFCPTLSINSIFSSDNTTKLKIIYGIAAGMSYLHSHNIIHRDLKPSTIFLDDRLFPKISCFHLCNSIDPNSPERSNFIQGTPAYLAPEVYTKQEFSKESDVYAFSLILYQIMTNNELFQGLNERPGQLRQFIIEGGRPNNFGNIPNCYSKLIQRCWSENPKERPSFGEIIDLLKNDREFITEDVSEKDFRDYIKIIEESKSSFDSSKIMKQNDENSITKSNHFDFCVQSIFDTQYDSVHLYMYYFDLKNFVKGRRIGRGRYSDTYEIYYQDPSNDKSVSYRPFAAKIFKSKLKDIYDLFSQEFIINSQINNHPCINRLVGYSPIDFEGRKYPIIVFDCYCNSSLDKLFELHQNNKSFQSFNDTIKLIIIYGIAAGMNYLHSENIIHQDLNPSNIFLDFNLFPKIGDFGTADYCYDFTPKKSKQTQEKRNENEVNNNNEEDEEEDEFSSSSYYKSFVVNRTPLYMAPEVLMENESCKSSDVYSFALIVYELMTNEKPFNGLNNYEIVREVVGNGNRPSFNKEIPSSYKNLIEKCWNQDPSKRPTFEEIVNRLQTNLGFITESVNKELFYKYIQFVNNGKEIQNITTSNECILNSHFDLISKNESENHLSIDLDQIDLNEFEYNKQNILGEGSFGKVYKIYKKKTVDPFAAKVLKHYLEKYSFNQFLNINREVNNISKLNFPSVVKYIGYNKYNFNHKPKLTIITEFVPNGTLDEMIEKDKFSKEKKLNETKKLIIIYGIAAGMAHVHRLNIIHRDLKPANVFLDDQFHPKIGDFGLSKDLTENSEINKIIHESGIKGSYAFIAPEIFTDLKYEKACDVFSFSLIVYQILTYDFFYRDFSKYKILLQVPNDLRPNLNDNIPECYRNLMKKCWSSNPDERLTFDEIVNILKTDESFITEKVNKEEFLNYVHEIDQNC